MSFLRSIRVRKPSVVEAADVAGADEAFAVGRVPLGFARLLSAGCDSQSSCVRRMADDFAGFARRRPRARRRRSAGCRGRAGRPTVCSLSGYLVRSSMQVPPPSVMP